MSFSNPYWSSHVELWEESISEPVVGLSLWSSKLQYLHLQKPKRLGLLQKIDALWHAWNPQNRHKKRKNTTNITYSSFRGVVVFRNVRLYQAPTSCCWFYKVLLTTVGTLKKSPNNGIWYVWCRILISVRVLIKSISLAGTIQLQRISLDGTKRKLEFGSGCKMRNIPRKTNMDMGVEPKIGGKPPKSSICS